MATKKLTAKQSNDLNTGACNILMARLQAAIDAKRGVDSPTWADAGDSRDIAEQLAILVRRAEGVDAGDDYGREILAGLGIN